MYIIIIKYHMYLCIYCIFKQSGINMTQNIFEQPTNTQIMSRCTCIAYILEWGQPKVIKHFNISPYVLHNKQLSHLSTLNKLSREQQPQLALEKMGTKRWVFPGSPTTTFYRLISEPTFL